MTGPAVADVVERLRAAGCVFAEDEARLLVGAASGPSELDELVRRRAAGEPLEVLLGWVEFCGLRLAVSAGVFVPRRRTELLVRLAVDAVAPGAVVLDLCCGVGAVAAAVLARADVAEVHAIDIEPAAVRCARANLAASAPAHVHEGDLFAPIPVSLRGRIDVIAANAPYVPTDAIAFMPPEARDHEPRVALDGGADGADLHRRIAAEAPRWLRPGGQLLMETGEQQAAITRSAFEAAGLVTHVEHDEDLDATVVLGSH